MRTHSRRSAVAAPARRRPAPTLLAAALLALLTLASPSAASGTPASADTTAPTAAESVPGAPVEAARLAEDGRRIVLSAADGETAFGIEEWRAWAHRHLADAVREPLAIGPVEKGVDDFDRFGVAVPSPDGGRVLFSATTYALLTTLSLVGVLDVETGAITMHHEPRTGDLEAVAWSPDGRHAAYALGTARAGGEELWIDAWPGDGPPDAAASVTLTRQAMHDAWRAADAPVGEELPPDRYMPRFRDLAWSPDGERLSFTADAPGAPHRDAPPAVAGRVREAPPLRWSLGADGGDLRLEGPAPRTRTPSSALPRPADAPGDPGAGARGPRTVAQAVAAG